MLHETLLFTFCPLSGIILDGILKYFKIMFPVYGFRLTIFRPFGGVVDNFKVTSYNVASRIIYEWGTYTGAIRGLRFEIVNIEIKNTCLYLKKILTLLVWYKHTKNDQLLNRTI
jgi:hypothetical protein